uniref:AHNAK nucleoprotein 2 n=1 Tax=Sciurus vulgaris TaxID=55149 RepID=A0A8D2CQE8_SCIVU
LSRLPPAAEVTMETEVEAGASGYSVTGGGHQGIFVKQVLKDSSAAKLFSLREGDQLLSATIFFDDIKYEDALKILQYSEPYKIQFKIRRKLPATKRPGLYVAEECTETPTKMPEADGDQERLISKPRMSRGRRPQERLSWPKFQAIKGKRGPGPRRSHSSSEACEPGDVSPTRTDTEAQLPEELLEQKAGPGRQRRRKFLNFRLKMGSGQDPSAAGHQGKGAQGRPHSPGVLGETGPWDKGPEDMGAAAGGKTPGEGAGVAARGQGNTQQVKAQQRATAHSDPRPGTDAGPQMGWAEEREEGQGLEMGTARLSLLDTGRPGSTQAYSPGTQVQVREVKTSKSGISKEKVPETERDSKGLELRKDGGRTQATAGKYRPAGTGPTAHRTGKEEGTEQTPETLQERACTQDGKDRERREARVKVPRFKMSSLGWSPSREEGDSESLLIGTPEKDKATTEKYVKRGDREPEGRDSKFKMPKFKMPSFRVSTASKGLDGSAEVTAPKVENKEALASIQGDLKHPEGSIQMPTAEMDAGAVQVGVTLSEATLPEGELPEVQATGLSTKGHFPKVQMPSIQMPKVELKGPQVDIKGPQMDGKGPKVEVSIPDMDKELPTFQVDIQALDTKLEGDMALEDKDVSTRDSKFKMPKFEMPSFGVSAPGKALDPSVELTVPKVEAEVALPSIQGDLKSSDLTIQLPSADLDASDVQVGVTLPDATMPKGDLPDVPVAGARLEGHLPKVQMPSTKMPRVDLKGPKVDGKGPKVDGKGPKVEVSIPDMDKELPSLQVDIQAPDTKLEGDVALADNDVSSRDNKFKMPKFKMPSFGLSAPGKALDASLEVKAPKMEADVALLSIQGDLKVSDLSIQLPSTDLDAKTGQVGVTLPEATLPEGHLPEGPAAQTGLKGHLPKVQVPSITMPKVDLKGPQVHIKGPKLGTKGPKGEMSTRDVEVEMPSMQVDIQAPDAKLEGNLALADKDVSTRDSKFKMPKFKMPSFGLTAPGKGLDGSTEVTVPKMEAGEVVPSIQGDLKHPDVSIQVPTAEMDAGAVQVGVTLSEATLPEGELPEVQATGLSTKGHFPKVQMPSIQMPKVELKGPQVDIKGPQMNGKGPKVEVSIPDMDKELPTLQVDIQAPDTKLEGDMALEDKDGSTRDSKFKMPKFKIPSFSLSAPGKALDASLEVKAPTMEADVALPSIQGDLKGSDLSIQLSSTDLDAKTGQVGVTLPEATLPEGLVPEGPAAQTGLKGHLPKVQVPSITMPKVDLKGPQVHIKGLKLGTKGPKDEMSTPAVEVEMPSMQVDIQAPDAKLEGNLALADKDVSTRDSKFKMPKFKMPSLGVSAPGKALDPSVELTVPKVEAEVALPSIQGDLKSSDLTIQLPSADLDASAVQVGVTLPDATMPKGELPDVPVAGARLEGHLPKVQMPSIKVPRVDLKGPKMDGKGPKVDGKGPKVEVSIPDMDKELPSLQVDIQGPDTKLEGDVALEDKDVSTRDSKFKMPKFKMPSFGLSAPGKALDASLEVKAPKMEADVALLSIQGDLKGTDLSIQMPSTNLDAKTGQLGVTLPEATLPEGHLPEGPAAQTGLKGHLPKVQVPSVTKPKEDLKGPQVHIKGPKLGTKGPKGEMSTRDVEVEMPSMQVDIQAPDAKLEGNLALADKDVSTRDSKFKMPKFKMPSFGLTAPGKGLDGSTEVTVPKMEAGEVVPSIQGDLKHPDVSIQGPSAQMDAGAVQVGVTLSEATLPEGELSEVQATGLSTKGHFPKVHMPSIQMPKVELKGPQVDIKGPQMNEKGPKVKVSIPDMNKELPTLQVDIQALDTKLEGDMALEDKDVSTRDSKFKMPKFKMPSFGLKAPGKGLDRSIEVTAPKMEAGEAVPSIEGDLKHPDVSIQVPTAEMDAGAVQVGVTLSEATLPEGELPEDLTTGPSMKGHRKLHVPSIKMPKVELKGPQVDIKEGKVDMKGLKCEVSTPSLDMEMPSVQVDMLARDAKLEGERDLAEKDVVTKDSKFKMPKFKMPSFGVSAPARALDVSVEDKMPGAEADHVLPSIQGDLKSSDLTIQLPSTDLDTSAVQVAVKLPDATMPEGDLKDVPVAGARLGGHLPKVQMPSIKTPIVDLKVPKVDGKGPKVEVSIPDVDKELLSLQVDIQAPDTKLEGDMALEEKDGSTRDSKFKMPKFKMPSFGLSAPGKALDASLEVKAPKMEADVALPSIQGDLKSSDLSIQLPSTDLDAKTGQVGVTLPEATLLEGHVPEGPAAQTGLKGHLPKVQVPSVTKPKVDLKGPQVHIKGPKLGTKGPKGEMSTPAVEVEMPSVQVDIQAPDAKLEGNLALADKDVSTRDSKFKMPKFKMPSLGVSAPGKALDPSVKLMVPKVEAEVALPSIQGDLKSSDLTIQLPSTDLDASTVQAGVTLPEASMPEGELPDVPVAGARLEGHLPKVQMPSIKMPRVDLKGTKVDGKGPKVDGKGPKVEMSIPDVDVEIPSVQVDVQAPDAKLEGDVALADKDMSTRDSKFKMPKFKMPSFGVSAPGKALDPSVEFTVPMVEAEVALPSIQGDLKSSDLTIQLSSDLDASTVQVGVTLPDGTMPEGERPDIPVAGARLEGHLPKVQMPSIKVPRVDLKGPKMDGKGPKVDGKGPKVEVSIPDMDKELPSLQVDIQAPDTKLEGDVALADKDVSTRDSKFKMPKFKMPSFGVSAPGKALDPSVEFTVPMVEAEVALPSIQGDLKSSDLTIQLSSDLDASTVQVGVTLPDGTMPEGERPDIPVAGARLEGHLPKVQMPSIKVPRVDLKGPKMDGKGPKVDGKGPKVEVSIPDMDKELPSLQVDIQAPDTKLEGDVALTDKDVSTRDSKFKMPTFKMPSFGLSAPGKALDASLEVKAPKMEADVALLSIQGDLKGSDLSIQLPSTDLDAKTGQVGVTLPEATLPEGHLPEGPAAQTGLKGHLPKVQVPSITMPKVDLKGPQVHIKGPKLGTKGPKGEMSTPAVELEMPSVQVDFQAPDAKLEGNLALADKDVSTRDSKFKMPKFKMPSFGLTAPGKGLDGSIEVTEPKVEAGEVVPSIQGDLKHPDVSIQGPSAEMDAGAVQVGVTLSEATLPKGELPEVQATGLSTKGHFPKVHMPSIQMPKVELKGPQVDIKGPKVDGKGPKVEVSIPDVDVEIPSVQVDVQAPDAKLEGDVSLAEKDMSTRNSKFKMPKFKMPSFGLKAPGKGLDGSTEVTAPKMEAGEAVPSIQGDLKHPDVSIQGPSAEIVGGAVQVGVTLSEATLPEGELPEVQATGLSTKGHFPKVQMPSIQMPKVELKGPSVDIKGPKVDGKGPKVEVSIPDVDVEIPSVQVDVQAPDAKLEGNLALADKDVSTRDSKFKMPKFKMPSFGVSAPGKALDPSVKLMVPKVEAEVALPSIQGDLKSSDLTIQLPSADLDASAVQVGVTLPDATMPKGDLPDVPVAGARLEGHLPKVQMPSIKMPRVDLKGPWVDGKGPMVDGKGPKVEVSIPDVDKELPSLQVDIQAPDTKLEGDVDPEDKYVATRDSKFKMPKFKMPSFGLTAPGKGLDGSIEVTAPKMEAGEFVPSIQGDLKHPDVSIQVPTAEMDAGAVQVGVTLSEATLPKGELPEVQATGLGRKGHFPKVQMPSIQMPKVELKGPQVDIKGPEVDGKGPKVEVSIPDMDKELPTFQVDIQALDTKLEGDVALEDKDGSTRDSKFKMPKFKMPSFGLSAPGKALDASLEVKAPKMEADVALPSIQGDLKGSDLSIQLPSTVLDAKTGQVGVTLPEATLPEGHVPEGPAAQTGLKGHLPKVQVPSITMPKVDLKGPQVHIKGPKLGTKGPTVEMSTPDVEVEMPSVQVDFQAPDAKLEGNLALADKDVSTRDSKFKMPKFKMPSFGLTAPGKGLDGSTEVTVPKVEAGEVVPSIQGDLKHPDVSIQVPTAEMDAGAVQVGVTLSEATLPEGELPEVQATGLGRKGHFPKVQMPSIQMPKVELKGPQVDIKGPEVDGKGPKVEVSIPDMDKELPTFQVDIQALDTKLEGDVALEDKDVFTRDSKFKMPKFKMPSFGLSAPGKALDASLEVKAPKMEADVALPSIQGDLKGSDLSIQLPSTDLDAKTGQVGLTLPEATLPEGHVPECPAAQTGLKGHLPKVQVPSITMPKVDLKGPQVHIKGPKLGTKGPTVEISTPDVEVEMPSMQVDIQAPDAKLEGNLALADKDVSTRDSKFKMPKFKMPSFGVSVPGKALDPSVELTVPKVEAEVALPSIQGDLKSSDLTIQLPSTDLDASDIQVGVTLPDATMPEGELPDVSVAGARLEGHLPKVQMPSIKMPRVDLKGPEVDGKGPKVDGKGPKVEVSIPDVDKELPSLQVDIQAPDTKLEGDVDLADKDVSTRDSKFKMPKFKMPSFGLSAPGKALDASLEVKAPKMEADVALPSIQGDLKGSDLSIQLPSTDLDAKTGQVGVTLPEATLPDGHLAEGPAAQTGLKGHLPKVQVPSITMPKVDLKGPQVHIKGPKLGTKGPTVEMSTPDVEVEMPSVQVDFQAPDAKLEGNLALADKDVSTRDSKFKMPKFKMPSFGLTAPGKGLDGSTEVTVPKMEAGEVVPSIQGDLKHPDVSIQVPTAEMDAGAVQVGVTLSEATLPEGELPEVQATGLGRKGHFPKVQMPSIQMPKVELTGPQVDIKGSQMEGKGPKVEVSIPDVDVGIPSVQVDVQAPDAKLEGDVALADKYVSSRDSKFKMPKFKMPSFGLSAPGKALDVSLEVKVPKMEAHVALPSIQGDLRRPDVSIQLPVTEMDSGAVQLDVVLPEATIPEGELLQAPAPSLGLKGHVPKVQVSSAKMPTVDIKGPKVDVKGPKQDVSTPVMDIELSPVPVDIQTASATLDGDLSLADKDVVTEDRKFTTLDVDTPFPKKELELKFRRPHFKFSKFSLPHNKVGEDSAGLDEGSGVSLLSVSPRPSSASPCGDTDSTLNHTLGPLFSPGAHAECPQPSSCSLQHNIPCSGSETSAVLQVGTVIPVFPTEHRLGPEDTLPPVLHARVTFPKFHKPKFGFSSATAVDAEADAPAADGGTGLSLLCPVEGVDSSGERAMVASLPSHGERTAPTPPQDVPPAESAEEGTAAGASLAGGQERLLRAASFHTPGGRRPSSREQGASWEQDAAKSCMQAAPAPAEAFSEPGSEEETRVAPRSSEAEAEATAPESESHADVPSRHLGRPGLRLHLPAAPMCAAGPGGRTHPTEDFLPLQMPRERPERQPPPGKGCGEPPPRLGGGDLVRAAASTETRSLQPEGPVKLKASRTDLPSQVSVVSVDQLWEDSVLTVTFPKLKVPRFSFPESSSEADVFFPIVRDVPCVEAGAEAARLRESPGLWGASLLRAAGTSGPGEQPEGPDFSLEAPPVSKVRVHIQESRGESQGITICSGVTGECAGLGAPETFSSQIVRESEIPASTVEMPSYGFSLLKAKIPEPPAQASTYALSQDLGAWEHPGGAPGGDAVPGDPRPDPGEPFEVISTSANLPGPQAFTSEVCSGLQLADGGSDEEPAEILEFPFDSSLEATTQLAGEDRAPKEKPEGKKPSGLLWSWLPNIGFSSMDESSAEAGDDAGRSAPIQTQPGAQSDPEPPKKQERVGWFRFPRLGFSSSPAKKSKGAEAEAGLAEQKLQEEAATFFDARESFSPEEEEDEVAAGAAGARLGSRGLVAASARTALTLLEHGSAGEGPVPGAE